MNMWFKAIFLAFGIICLAAGLIAVPVQVGIFSHVKTVRLSDSIDFINNLDQPKAEGVTKAGLIIHDGLRVNPIINIVKVVKDRSVTLSAQYFPVGQTFQVLMTGSDVSYAAIVGEVSRGKFKETYSIPDRLIGEPRLTLWFKNSRTGQTWRKNFENENFEQIPEPAADKPRYHFPHPTATPRGRPKP